MLQFPSASHWLQNTIHENPLPQRHSSLAVTLIEDYNRKATKVIFLPCILLWFFQLQKPENIPQLQR